MRVILSVALLTTAAGCTTPVRSTGTVPYPHDGVHLLYSHNGHLMQKTVWHHGKLVAAWEYQRRQDLPDVVIEAVNRGERDRPEPRWTQIVKNGKGMLSYLDEDGHDIGFAEYCEGQYRRGAPR